MFAGQKILIVNIPTEQGLIIVACLADENVRKEITFRLVGKRLACPEGTKGSGMAQAVVQDLKTLPLVEDGGEGVSSVTPEIPRHFMDEKGMVGADIGDPAGPEDLVDFQGYLPGHSQVFKDGGGINAVKTTGIEIVGKMVGITDNIYVFSRYDIYPHKGGLGAGLVARHGTDHVSRPDLENSWGG